MEIINIVDQTINVNAVEDIININAVEEIIDINVTEEVINIVTQTGAYPLPNNVYSVFGRVGNVIGEEGDYSLTQLSGVTIASPSNGQVLQYNGTTWVNAPIDSANWDTAYNNSIVSASVSGVTTKTITLSQQDGGTVTASWTDNNTDAVTSVFGRTGAITAQSGDYDTLKVTENTNLYYTDQRARYSVSGDIAAGVVYSNTLGVISLDDIPNTSLLHPSVTVNGHTIALGDSYSLTTTDIAEGNNKYYTDARVYNAISATAPISEVSGVISINQASATTNGYLSSTDWSTFNNKQATITTGDLTSSDVSVIGGTGAVIGTGTTLTLATVNSNVGQYGSSTAIPVVTVNAKGLVTAISSTAVSIPSGSLSFIGDVTGTGNTGSDTTLTLKNVNANVYASNTFIKTAVNAKGLTTSAIPVISSDITTVLGYTPENVANKSTSTSLGTSDTLYPSQAAVKSYVDSATTGGIILQGDWNAATNTPDISGTTKTGWAWNVSVSGTTNIGGITDWGVKDWVVKTATGWTKLDNTDSVNSVFGRFGSVVATSGDYNTSQVTENTNLYFTNARALNSTLTNFIATQGVVTSSDTILSGLQKIAANALDVSSTGVFSFGGVSLASSTLFNVGAAEGFIVDNTTNIDNPSVLKVVYAGGTNLTNPNLTTATETYILLDASGILVLQPTFPTPQQRRQKIYLGKLGHPDKTSYLNAFSQPDSILSPLSQLRDIWTPINLINGGVYPSPNGANLQFNTSAGSLYGLGINFANSPIAPSTVTVSAQSPTTFRYRTQTGGTGGNITTIDPTKYDNAGTITTNGGANGTATNQRIYCLQNGQIRIQYGQQVYNSLTTAIEGIQTESFVTFPNFKDNAILIGILSLTKNCNDLTNTTRARFLLVSKFGESVGAAGGITTATLQQAYDNSIQPEIVTNTTLGAITFKRGSSADTDNVFEIQNGASSNTAYIDGLGNITANSFIKTSGTSSQFLKANGTVDSNTYYLSSNPSSFITLGSLSSSTPLNYNNTTGAFTITQSSTTTNGYLSSTDWNTFNNKQATITLTTTSNSGASTLVGATLNIPTYTLAGLGGINLGSLSATSPLLYNNTTGVFSIQQSSGSQAGYLSSTDWSTFNNKQAALTNPVTGTGTANYLTRWTASGTVNNSSIYQGATGFISIGNTNSTYNLDVTGTGRFTTQLSVGATLSSWGANWRPLQMGSYGSFISGRTDDNSMFIGKNVYFDGTNWIGTTTGYAQQMFFDNTGATIFRNISATVGTATGFNETMRITASGNVGIGTITPNVSGQSTNITVLTVQGKSGVWGGVETSAVGNTSASALMGFYGFTNPSLSAGYNMVSYIGSWLDGGGVTSGANMRFHTQANGTAGAVERIRITSTGYVLIGATTSTGAGSGRLQVSGTSTNAQFLLTNTGGHLALYTTGTDAYLTRSTGGFMAFGIAPQDGSTFTENMRIQSDGRFLVATSSALSPGGVTGVSNMLNPNNDGLWALAIQNNATTASYGRGLGIRNITDFNTASNEVIFFVGNGTPRFFIMSNGGIYNYSANNSNLSDERTKKDIIPLESYWDKFKAIEIVKYKYKDQTHDDYNIGLIAQQVEKIAPEFVNAEGFGGPEYTPEDGIPLKSIYEADLHHATIKVLQECMAKIESLELELTELKATIAK